MSNLTGGSILWNLDVDSSKLSGGLKSARTEIESTAKDSESRLKSLGESFSNVGKKMSLAVTAPIVAIGTASFKMAADLDDAIGATNQIFKGQSQAMQTWANTIPTYYGIAEGEALNYANTMGAMLQNIGGLTEEQASKQAQTLITLAGDLTAMFGGTTQDAIRALTGSLKGNNTMLDNYGMAVNDAMIKTKAYELGLMKEGDEMSLATKQAATLALITEQTADVTGQASREAGGASGSMRAFQTEVKNLSTQIGKVLLPVITPLIKNLSELVKKFVALSPEQKEMIIKIVGIVAAIGPLLIIIGSAIKMFGTLQTIITVVGGVIAGISAPVLIAIGIITALIGVGVLLYKNWDKIVAGLTSTLTTVGNAIGGFVNSIFGVVKNFFQNIKNIVSGFFEVLKTDDIGNFSDAMKKFGASDELIKFFGKLSGKIRDFLSFIKELPTIISTNFEKMVEFFKALPGIVGNFLISLPGIIGNFFWQGVLNIVYSIGYIYAYLSVKIPELIDNIGKWFSKLPGMVWTFLTETYNNFTKWGTNTWDYLSTTVSNWITNIGIFFSQLPGKIWGVLTTAYNNVTTWGSNTGSYLSNTVSGWINNIANWFSQLPGKISSGLSNLGSTIRNAFVNAWNYLSGEISQWSGRIWDWGRNIANSFVEGFKNALGSIGRAFTDGINNAKRNMQGNSPPKEGPLKEIDKWGFNIGEAWVSGFAGSIGKLGSLVNQSLSPLQDVMGYGGVNMAGVDSNGGNTQNISINGVSIRDKSDIDALIRQLGFKLSTI